MIPLEKKYNIELNKVSILNALKRADIKPNDKGATYYIGLYCGRAAHIVHKLMLEYPVGSVNDFTNVDIDLQRIITEYDASEKKSI